MKKYLIAVASLLVGLFLFDYLFFQVGVIYLPHRGEPEYHSMAKGEKIFLDMGNGFEEFTVKGVDLGLAKPGHYATELAITKEEYLRWFSQIQELGANVIRTYTVAGPAFYEAFYEYNVNNDNPLYLIHGVWVDDYLINSSFSALDAEFFKPFLKSCKQVVDVVHGRNKGSVEGSLFRTYYKWDISPWVIGYIMGVEWENTLVGYTDYSLTQEPQFSGDYFYTEDASNFEIFLARVGEEVVRYETKKYGTQRMTAFSNWPTTDPLEYNINVIRKFGKTASIDVEHIKCTENFKSGQFASYHIYPYYPDYYKYQKGHEQNTYLQYLTDINAHHTIPVVISEFGVPSSRGMAAREEGLGRNQGGMSETQQGYALVSMYQDIIEAGSAGGIAFSWQDEWFKRTWNTLAATDLLRTPYWSDYQTNGQYFGLLSFDPGKEKSICYVDGDRSEWTEKDRVTIQDGFSLSMKYDEKFIYFLVEKDGWNLTTDKLYIPIDTTPKSGSLKADNLAVSMSEASDFIIEIDGKRNSHVWVQEYYDMVSALYYNETMRENVFSRTYPSADSAQFLTIRLLLNNVRYYERSSTGGPDTPLEIYEYDMTNIRHYRIEETYETGKLTYGNANPDSPDFNSLADFCAGEGFVEIKLPWQLLNVADPTTMRIHDDYYECYGVEYLTIDSIRVGVGDGSDTIQMASFPMKKLGRKPEYHERLKQSYYILQAYWTGKTTQH